VRPVHLAKPVHPNKLKQFLYSIHSLAELPGLETRLSAQDRQVGIHISGALIGQTTIRVGGDILLGTDHHPSVERGLYT
jgi:hypothetical protein